MRAIFLTQTTLHTDRGAIDHPTCAIAARVTDSISPLIPWVVVSDHWSPGKCIPLLVLGRHCKTMALSSYYIN